MPEIRLSQGTIHYREAGSGEPLVLIHGLLVNGNIWDRLVPLLQPHYRCIVPDLPLGSHGAPMAPEADLTPRGLAALIDELLAHLGLDQVTLVGNDTGGALCQLVVAHHPARIGRLVLTNCDAFEHFPPANLKPLISGLGRAPGALAALATLGKVKAIRRGSMSMAALTSDPVPDELTQSWVAPLGDRLVRRDVRKVLRAISPEYTLAAAERLRDFERPVLLAWGTRDRYFPVADAERLANVFPNAKLELIEGARTFTQLDAPDRVAELITNTHAKTDEHQEVAP